ncbi:MAG: hypothetical protein ACUVUF_05185 [Candidatus Bathycorpusculaceae bacterium]
MNLTLRMTGIATTFFWIFLTAFLASAAYSAKDLHFDFGEPQIAVTSENKVLFYLPINIINKGYYDIDAFNVTTQILGSGGGVIAKGSTFVPKIGKGENLTTSHNMTLEISELLQHSSDYLFNDSELEVEVFAGMRLAELVPVGASTNLSVPWGAPFYNFMLGEPSQIRFNRTHLQVTVPISFENHAFFDVAGNIEIKMYNSSGMFVGEKQFSFEAPQYTSYIWYIELYVLIAEFTPNGYFEVYFLTSAFDYGPMVISHG